MLMSKLIYLTTWLTNLMKLNEIFHALADPTRREIIHMMAQKERTVSELAEPFDMSLAAISKHIKVLERANLVERSVTGRTHICSLNTNHCLKLLNGSVFMRSFGAIVLIFWKVSY